MSREEEKRATELAVFLAFAEVANLGVEPGTIRQDGPPAPDIVCRIAGGRVCFELGRLAHPTVVQSLVETGREAARSPDGASHGEPVITFVDEPWNALFSSKARAVTRYRTDGAPLHLLAWLDSATDPAAAEAARLCWKSVRETALCYPEFRKVWLFDFPRRQVLFGVDPERD